MSVDVEDYFHVEAFSGIVDRSQWDSYSCRVQENTRFILDLLSEFDVRGTFFVLGWVAERFPGLVREIAARGHELACHSYWHRLIYQLTPEEFREDTLRAKDIIEQASGTAIFGYRAPSYSITRRSLWALDILAEVGFAYDSSIFPIHHDIYGIPDSPRKPYRVETQAGSLLECPITTFRWRERNMPVGGGGYLRIFPWWYTRFGIRSTQREGVPLIVYFHPWEVDPEQPRLPGRLKSRLRHYTNLRHMETRLRRLLQLMPFTSFRDSEIGATAVDSVVIPGAAA